MTVSEPVYMAIDPGKRTGLNIYDEKGNILGMYTIAGSKIISFLQDFVKIKVCIIEGYRVFPHKAKAHVYSDLETPRIIGRVEAWAEVNGIKLVKQRSADKTMGYKYQAEEPAKKSNPQNDVLDAHAHFIFWAVNNGVIKPEQLIELVERRKNV